MCLQEKEDRRQQLLMVKAQENKRRMDERDRRKEQIKTERQYQKERKLVSLPELVQQHTANESFRQQGVV